jgi:hypothetical protein
MASLFERLDGEAAAVRQRIEDLRGQLTAAEERLVRLTITRETLATLPEEPGSAPAADAGVSAVAVTAGTGQSVPSTGPSPPAVSTPAHSAEPQKLNPVNEQVVVMMVSAGRPMRAKEVAAAMGEPDEHRRVETVRARLKRLVETGWLAEIDKGVFAIAAGINGHAARLGGTQAR